MPGDASRSNNFRLQAKGFFLTYSQCPIPKEDYLDLLKRRQPTLPPVYEILVVQELHQDGNPHLHVWIKFDVQLSTRDQRYFDCEYNGANYHGRYEVARSPKAVIGYCTKTKDTQNFWGRKSGPNGFVEYTPEIKVTFKDVLHAETETEFFDLAARASARDYILQHDRLQSFARQRYRRPAEYTSQYSRTDFTNLPGDMVDWDFDYLRYVKFFNLTNLTPCGAGRSRALYYIKYPNLTYLTAYGPEPNLRAIFFSKTGIRG